MAVFARTKNRFPKTGPLNPNQRACTFLHKLDELVLSDDNLMQFLDTKKAVGLKNSAQVVAAWDFNTSIGNTIRDKYDSLFVKIVEVTSVLLRKGASGCFWLVMSPEIFSIMDAATSDKKIAKKGPFGLDAEQEMMGLQEGILNDMGVMSRRWRCLVTAEWPFNQLLIGCGSKENLPEHYARLIIANFVI